MNSGTDTTAGTGTGAGAGVGGKVRLYEVAKDLGLPNKDLVAKVRALGIEVKNHMSNLDVEDVARVKRALDKERQANLVEERLSSTVIRRRSKDGSQLRAAAPATRPTAAETRAEAPPAGPPAASPSTSAPSPPMQERASLEARESAEERTREERA